MRGRIGRAIGRVVRGLQAGLLISIGGAVYLACHGDTFTCRAIGAVFFSVALLCICKMGYSLYTGKIGFMLERHDGEAISVLLWGLLGNLLSTALFGSILRLGVPSAGETAAMLCTAKLSQAWWQTLIRGVFCGVLMYLAVAIYRNGGSIVGILFCVPVFILAGFEHSVADAFYFAAAGMALKADSVIFITVTIIGNTIGAWVLPLMDIATRAPATAGDTADKHKQKRNDMI